MAVIVKTESPKAVLSAIKKAIENKEAVTWTYDSDGDFTHTPDQWRGKAWMRPTIGENKIIFKVLRPQGKSVSVAAYAVYHGRLVEMILRHADNYCSEVTSTADPSFGDTV